MGCRYVDGYACVDEVKITDIGRGMDEGRGYSKHIRKVQRKGLIKTTMHLLFVLDTIVAWAVARP
jgi:hypothetical protein